MLLRYQDMQFIGRFCKTIKTDYGLAHRLVDFETATEEDKLRLINFDNSFYEFNEKHLILNIDEVKASIGYKDKPE